MDDKKQITITIRTRNEGTVEILKSHFCNLLFNATQEWSKGPEGPRELELLDEILEYANIYKGLLTQGENKHV